MGSKVGFCLWDKFGLRPVSVTTLVDHVKPHSLILRGHAIVVQWILGLKTGTVQPSLLELSQSWTVDFRREPGKDSTARKTFVWCVTPYQGGVEPFGEHRTAD